MESVAIRASSLSELFDCPARWAAKHLDGLRMPSSGAAQLGTAVHAGTALYDTSRLPGGSPITIDDAAGAVVESFTLRGLRLVKRNLSVCLLGLPLHTLD